MAILKLVGIGVAVLVCCIVLAAVLPDVLLSWYETDTNEIMAFGEEPDKVGLLSWKLFPFFGLAIILFMFVAAARNSL